MLRLLEDDKHDWHVQHFNLLHCEKREPPLRVNTPYLHFCQGEI